MKIVLLTLILSSLHLVAAVTAVSGLDSENLSKQHTDQVKIWTLTKDHGWKSKVHFGASLADGNSNSTYITAGFTLDKKRGQNEYLAKFSYAYGEDNDQTSKDEILALASWKRTGSHDFYTGVRADFRKDNLADINYRFGVTALQGYNLIKKEKCWLTPEIGIGFSSQEINGEQNEFINLYAGVHSEFKFNEKTRLYQNLSMFTPLEDIDRYWIYGEIGIETLLTDRVSLKLYIQNQYEARPATGREHNDFRFITSLEYKF